MTRYCDLRYLDRKTKAGPAFEVRANLTAPPFGVMVALGFIAGLLASLAL